MKKPRPRRTGPRSGLMDRIGIAWLHPETHARLSEVMVEPSGVPWLYERWREQAETKESHWKSTNRLVVRVVIDAEVFLGWCDSAGVIPNGEALDRYVTDRTHRQLYPVKAPKRPRRR
jgi:hypothetical protein